MAAACCVLLTGVLDAFTLVDIVRYPPEVSQHEAALASDKQQLTALLQALRLARQNGIDPVLLAEAWTGELSGWNAKSVYCIISEKDGFIWAEWTNGLQGTPSEVVVEGVIDKAR